MGSWGIKLYQNDLAQDVKSLYKAYLEIGYSDLEVENMIIDSFAEEFDVEEYERIFWLVLADQEYKLGRLSKKVKKKALDYLKEPGLKELIGLKSRLESNPLPRKQMRKFYMKRSQYKIGDVLSYKIEDTDELNQENRIFIDKYILFEVTAMTRLNIGSLPKDEFYHEYPIITLLDWIGDKIPTSDEIHKIPKKKRKKLDDEMLENYFIDVKEDGTFKWKKHDFDTIQYTLFLSKKDTKELGIEKVYEGKKDKYIEVSSVGRTFLDKREFSNFILKNYK